MAEYVLQQIENDIAVVTLNRPEKRNALSPELVAELDATLDSLQQDGRIRAVILTGAGKAFCAGADLAYLKQLSAFTEEENLADSQNLARVFRKIYQFPKITVAMINGAALAGGCGLALCCDYRFASTEYARLGFTEVRIGFIPAIVMNFLIRTVTPGVAAHLALSGEILNADQAQEVGLVHRIFPAEALKTKTLKFVNNLLNQNSFSAMMQTKQLLQQLYDLPLSDGIQLASEWNARSRKTPDCQKGLRAFLNKEPIRWREGEEA